MSIHEMGSLGELLGSLAVLVTLVYLGIQTRQTKQIATGDAARNIVADFQHVWSALSESDEFTALVRRAVNDWPSLERNEQLRVHAFLVNLLIHLDSALSHEYLPEVKAWVIGWEDNVLGLIRTPGGSAWYDTCRYLFSDRLRARLEGRLSGAARLPPPWTEGMPWWRLEEGEEGRA